MFNEDFSFDTSRSPSVDSTNTATTDSSRSVSPCSAAGPYPPPRFSVTDLAAQFAGQRLRKESPICYDSCDAYANNDDDDGWSIPPVEVNEADQLPRSRLLPQRSHSPSRRIQRQLNTRLLCSVSHHRDIATLVARMVESNDQCSTAPLSPTSLVNVPEPDEGYSSSDEPMTATSRRSSVATVKRSEYRRSSDLKLGGACVSKNIRFRKDRGHRRSRNSETSS